MILVILIKHRGARREWITFRALLHGNLWYLVCAGNNITWAIPAVVFSVPFFGLFCYICYHQQLLKSLAGCDSHCTQLFFCVVLPINVLRWWLNDCKCCHFALPDTTLPSGLGIGTRRTWACDHPRGWFWVSSWSWTWSLKTSEWTVPETYRDSFIYQWAYS